VSVVVSVVVLPELLLRFMVGRSGSSAGAFPVWVLEAVVSVPEVVASGLRRFMVGRSGSSAGVLPVCVFDAVVEPLLEVVVSGLAVSELRRFMVGRLGSSDGVDAVLGVEPESVVVGEFVVPEFVVPELVVSELRRFMVGRSESSLVDVVLVLDAVVSDLLWSPPVAEVVSPVGFEPKCGRFGSLVVVMAGTVFDGFRAAVVVLRGAASGLTLP